ncbi:phosphate/sulfate permease [Methylorubrum rhodesianum]|nr:phosphate/sulfate permease [Methylorubrum rhodesianum]
MLRWPAALAIRLHREGVLSKGQVVKASRLSRIEVQLLATSTAPRRIDVPVSVVLILFLSGATPVIGRGRLLGIASLLPVELILQVGSGAGFAMVFALLIAAIIWKLGTWYFGLPASSSHTLIGSIVGVGVANSLMHGRSSTSGVDWTKATEIGWSLLLSPLFGFMAAGALLLVLRFVLRNPALYAEPKWRRWLGPEQRCLVPLSSFSEFNKAAGGDIWFAIAEDSPLAYFAGIKTDGWTSVRNVKDGETRDNLHAFPTTEPSAEVGAVHSKAMPVILTTDEERDALGGYKSPEATSASTCFSTIYCTRG